MRFATEGAAVVAVDIRGSKAQATAALINENGGHAIAIEANVSEAADVERMVAETVRPLGRDSMCCQQCCTIEPGTWVGTERRKTWDHGMAE
ncbi:UNVERIFIED_CONTAM: hypothetical protein GTU68_000847 [Idotea baltica]|nr:hypothetical protein [Idotea baltica]